MLSTVTLNITTLFCSSGSLTWTVQFKNTASSTLKRSAFHLFRRWPQLLVSLGYAREEKPGDSTANQESHHGQHSSEPYLHHVCAIRGGERVCGPTGQAVHTCEDVRMLLEHTRHSHALCTSCTEKSQLAQQWHVRSACVAAFLPQWGTWCYVCHLWNCCVSVFYPLAPTTDKTEIRHLCSIHDWIAYLIYRDLPTKASPVSYT